MDKLIIDGIEVEPDPNKTILEVAREQGISIPTLCSHKSLSPSGACRLCTVEVTYKGRTKLVTSCTYPAWPGEVKTNSDNVNRARKFVLQLMLASAPTAKKIRELADKYGVDDTPYKIRDDKWNEKCIMCGLCVRTCNEVMNIGAIGFAGRGSERYIATPLGEYSEICSTCGACEFVCPTDAIKVSDWTERPIKPIPSEYDRGVVDRPVVYVPFPQAVPNKPVIDKEHCMHFKNDACGVCRDVCEVDAIDFAQKDRVEEIEVGSVVLATGYELYPLEKIPEYGGGKIPNVVDSLYMERLLAPDGPTGGVPKRPSDGKIPKSIAFVHCVRSRDPEHGMPYCSRLCCMYLVKQAMLYKHSVHDGDVYDFYIDLRTNGKMYEEFYQRALEDDHIRFIRGRPAKIVQNGDKVQVWSTNTLTGQQIKVDVDMAVLAPAMIPNPKGLELIRNLRIPTDEYGWVKEQHLKLRPLESMTAGIFLAGVVQYPKDITDTVSQASGAAAKVLDIFSQPELERSPTIATVDSEICAGCGYCEEACAYGAIKVNPDKGIAEVNEALCEGCGACASVCPSGAAQHINFFKNQVHAMVLEVTREYE